MAEDCVFPFKHEGKEYKSCATPSDGNGAYCATKVDSKGNLVKDKWARCNEYCDNDKGDLKYFLLIAIYMYHIFPSMYM